MPQRNSPHAIANLSDPSHQDEIVIDKRLGQRSLAKKNRRNRHVEKPFIRNTLSHWLRSGHTKSGEHAERQAADPPSGEA